MLRNFVGEIFAPHIITAEIFQFPYHQRKQINSLLSSFVSRLWSVRWEGKERYIDHDVARLSSAIATQTITYEGIRRTNTVFGEIISS